MAGSSPGFGSTLRNWDGAQSQSQSWRQRQRQGQAQGHSRSGSGSASMPSNSLSVPISTPPKNPRTSTPPSSNSNPNPNPSRPSAGLNGSGSPQSPSAIGYGYGIGKVPFINSHHPPTAFEHPLHSSNPNLDPNLQKLLFLQMKAAADEGRLAAAAVTETMALVPQVKREVRETWGMRNNSVAIEQSQPRENERVHGLGASGQTMMSLSNHGYGSSSIPRSPPSSSYSSLASALTPSPPLLASSQNAPSIQLHPYPMAISAPAPNSMEPSNEVKKKPAVVRKYGKIKEATATPTLLAPTQSQVAPLTLEPGSSLSLPLFIESSPLPNLTPTPNPPRTRTRLTLSHVLVPPLPSDTTKAHYLKPHPDVLRMLNDPEKHVSLEHLDKLEESVRSPRAKPSKAISISSDEDEDAHSKSRSRITPTPATVQYTNLHDALNASTMHNAADAAEFYAQYGPLGAQVKTKPKTKKRPSLPGIAVEERPRKRVKMISAAEDADTSVSVSGWASISHPKPKPSLPSFKKKKEKKPLKLESLESESRLLPAPALAAPFTLLRIPGSFIREDESDSGEKVLLYVGSREDFMLCTPASLEKKKGKNRRWRVLNYVSGPGDAHGAESNWEKMRLLSVLNTRFLRERFIQSGRGLELDLALAKAKAKTERGRKEKEKKLGDGWAKRLLGLGPSQRRVTEFYVPNDGDEDGDETTTDREDVDLDIPDLLLRLQSQSDKALGKRKASVGGGPGKRKKAMAMDYQIPSTTTTPADVYPSLSENAHAYAQHGDDAGMVIDVDEIDTWLDFDGGDQDPDRDQDQPTSLATTISPSMLPLSTDLDPSSSYSSTTIVNSDIGLGLVGLRQGLKGRGMDFLNQYGDDEDEDARDVVVVPEPSSPALTLAPHQLLPKPKPKPASSQSSSSKTVYYSGDKLPPRGKRRLISVRPRESPSSTSTSSSTCVSQSAKSDKYALPNLKSHLLLEPAPAQPLIVNRFSHSPPPIPLPPPSLAQVMQYNSVSPRSEGGAEGHGDEVKDDSDADSLFGAGPAGDVSAPIDIDADADADADDEPVSIVSVYADTSVSEYQHGENVAEEVLSVGVDVAGQVPTWSRQARRNGKLGDDSRDPNAPGPSSRPSGSGRRLRIDSPSVPSAINSTHGRSPTLPTAAQPSQLPMALGFDDDEMEKWKPEYVPRPTRSRGGGLGGSVPESISSSALEHKAVSDDADSEDDLPLSAKIAGKSKAKKEGKKKEKKNLDKGKGKAVAPKANRAGWPMGPTDYQCHQDRTKSNKLHMHCSQCTAHYCVRCIALRYADQVDFDPSRADFVCFRCKDTCLCDICCRRRGVTYVQLPRNLPVPPSISSSFSFEPSSSVPVPSVPAPQKPKPSSSRKPTTATTFRPASLPTTRQRNPVKRQINVDFGTLHPIVPDVRVTEPLAFWGTIYNQEGQAIAHGFTLIDKADEEETIFAKLLRPRTSSESRTPPTPQPQPRVFIGEVQPQWGLGDHPKTSVLGESGGDMDVAVDVPDSNSNTASTPTPTKKVRYYVGDPPLPTPSPRTSRSASSSRPTDVAVDDSRSKAGSGSVLDADDDVEVLSTGDTGTDASVIEAEDTGEPSVQLEAPLDVIEAEDPAEPLVGTDMDVDATPDATADNIDACIDMELDSNTTETHNDSLDGEKEAKDVDMDMDSDEPACTDNGMVVQEQDDSISTGQDVENDSVTATNDLSEPQPDVDFSSLDEVQDLGSPLTDIDDDD